MSVLIETSLGDIVIDLYCDDCPNACKNFIKLCKRKFYNGALFINVQKNYLSQIQTLEPPTTIFGTEYFHDEQLNMRKHNKLGVVSTANIGPNKNNSDFFITLSKENLVNLNMKHTIFGQVQEGIDVIEKMNEIHVDDNHRPLLNIRIKHTVVLDDIYEDEDQDEKYPSRSPSPKNWKGLGRLEFEEKEEFIDKMNQRTEAELIEQVNEHKAKSRSLVLEMLEDIPDADIKPPDNILFLCKLNPITEEKDLEIIFSKFGTIKTCDIVRDWKTGQSLQYAFIEYESVASCEEAYLKMENALIDDRRIHVDFCQSVAKQWAQLKKAQRRKQMLHEQRNQFRQNRDTNQTMIDQLEVKNDYFNTRNNYNYVVNKPNQATVQEEEEQEEQPEIQIQAPPQQKKIRKSSSSQSSSSQSLSRSSSSSSSSSRSRSKNRKNQHYHRDTHRDRKVHKGDHKNYRDKSKRGRDQEKDRYKTHKHRY